MFRVLALTCLLAASAFSQQKTVGIQGKVVDMVGAVVANAPVIVVDLEKLEVQQLRTNSGGEFRLELVAGRRYQIFATFQCMGTASKSFRVEKARKLEIKLKAGNCGSTD